MARSRKFLTAGAVGVAAFALIGAGASASFKDAVTLDQAFSTGTLNVSISGPGTHAIDANGAETLTLPSMTNLGSHFYASSTVKVKNTGSLPAEMVELKVSDAFNGASDTVSNEALRNQLRVKVSVNGHKDDYAFKDLLGTKTIGLPTLAKGEEYTASIMFYGQSEVTGEKGLDNAAQAGNVTPTFKLSFEDPANR